MNTLKFLARKASTDDSDEEENDDNGRGINTNETIRYANTLRGFALQHGHAEMLYLTDMFFKLAQLHSTNKN